MKEEEREERKETTADGQHAPGGDRRAGGFLAGVAEGGLAGGAKGAAGYLAGSAVGSKLGGGAGKAAQATVEGGAKEGTKVAAKEGAKFVAKAAVKKVALANPWVLAVAGVVAFILVANVALLAIGVYMSAAVLTQAEGIALTLFDEQQKACMASSATVGTNGVGALLNADDSGILVMTFNVRKDTGKDHEVGEEPWSVRGPQAVAMIRAANPDIIGFQEVSTKKQRAYLESALPEYTFATAKKGATIPIAYRTARFERQSIVHTKQLNFRWRDGSTKNRFMRYVVLEDTWGGGEFLAANLHAEHTADANAVRARKAGWARMKEALDGYADDMPVFVTGDFNTYSHAKRTDYKYLLDGMYDMGFSDSGVSAGTRYSPVPNILSLNGWGSSFKGSDGKTIPRVVKRSGGKGSWWLDYVWANKGFRTTAWQIYTAPITWTSEVTYGGKTYKADPAIPVAEYMASDHWPVLAKLAFTSKGGGSSTSVGTTIAQRTDLKVKGVPADLEQKSIMATIIEVGKRNAVPERGIVIALMTATQESAMRNLAGGDRDSVGVFQQRPSSGWGTVEQIRNVKNAAEAFYGVADHTSNPGLLDIDRWLDMTPTQAAQAVQRSAYPDAYAKWWKESVANYAALEPYSASLAQLSAIDGNGVGICDVSQYQTGEVPTWNGETPPAYKGEPGGKTKPIAVRGARVAMMYFADHIKYIGGQSNRGSECSYSDHCSGHAIDAMVKGWKTAEGNAAGWRIAQFFQRNAEELGVTYIIWNRQLWNSKYDSKDLPPEKWRTYDTPRGVHNPTNDHYDHVHVSYKH